VMILFMKYFQAENSYQWISVKALPTPTGGATLV
jgi:hypothetical protein